MADDEAFADPHAVVPGTHWWAGPTACSICGWRGVSVVPIAVEHDEPIVPLECSCCGHFAVHPDDEESQS